MSGELLPVCVPLPSGDVLQRREESLARLGAESWDLLVVGGGIVGAGALLDATSRGLRAALVEQDDISAGTSSRSSRLIHGGLRYLEHMKFHLVHEALVERSRLLRLAPHLVRLEPFVFPVYGWPLVHRLFYGSGLVLYDLLGAARDRGRSRHLGADAVARVIPPIRRAGLRGGITYHDGVEDDARFTLAVVRTAEQRGATVLTRVRAAGILRGSDGSLRGVAAEDLLSGRSVEVRAAAVIDATGVWAGRSEAPLGGSSVPLVPSRGSHVLVSRERLPLAAGMTLRVPGKVLFIVPCPDAWVIGTTDEPDTGPPDRPTPTIHEVDAILDSVNDVLDVDLGRDDLLGAYTGLRPLVGEPGGSTVRVSREHKVHREANGLVRVSGGKYTTYRVMARDAVDVALDGRAGTPPSATAELRLAGAAPRPDLERLTGELASDAGIDLELARSLVDRHGTEARDVLALGTELDLLRPLGSGIRELEAEVAWAARQEAALSVDDVLARRMRLAMRLPDRGASIAGRVAEILGSDLGWTAGIREAEVERYLEGARREYDVPGARTAEAPAVPTAAGAPATA
jgi:glycerol-3-phosphate dehydrogenase